MSKKITGRVNGGLAIYYGMGVLILAILGFVGVGVWLYKVFTGQRVFSWGALIGMVSAVAIAGAIGYSLMRVGYEEIEK